MKTVILVWLMYNGAVIPESLTTATYASMAACEAKGQEIVKTFDGIKTLATAGYICSEAKVEV